MNICKDCAYYNHIYDENGMDAQCGGLCQHEDALIHGVPGMVEPNSTCVNWTVIEEELPFTDPPEDDDIEPYTKAATLANLRKELAKGERFVALMQRFIALVEKEPDSDAP
jgi:hypothetical protein